MNLSNETRLLLIRFVWSNIWRRKALEETAWIFYISKYNSKCDCKFHKWFRCKCLKRRETYHVIHGIQYAAARKVKFCGENSASFHFRHFRMEKASKSESIYSPTPLRSQWVETFLLTASLVCCVRAYVWAILDAIRVSCMCRKTICGTKAEYFYCCGNKKNREKRFASRTILISTFAVCVPQRIQETI